MKSLKYVIPVLALVAFAFVFSGCPGKSMIADDGMQKEETMAKNDMEKDSMDNGMAKDETMKDDGMEKDEMMDK